MAVHGADVFVAVLGEAPSRSGEAHSVADPGLPPGQEAWLERMVSFGVPLVAVVISGRATVLPACIEHCAAVLFSFHPGSEGGHVLADVLTGRQEPVVVCRLPCRCMPGKFRFITTINLLVDQWTNTTVCRVSRHHNTVSVYWTALVRRAIALVMV